MNNYRHGDVILKGVEAIPEAATVTARERIPIASSSTTGHSHIVEGAAKLRTLGEQRYLNAGEDVKLTHEEHGELPIEAGSYEVLIQREYTPEGWNDVQD
jgi:hypothetical protein